MFYFLLYAQIQFIAETVKFYFALIPLNIGHSHLTVYVKWLKYNWFFSEQVGVNHEVEQKMDSIFRYFELFANKNIIMLCKILSSVWHNTFKAVFIKPRKAAAPTKTFHSSLEFGLVPIGRP